MQNVLRLLKARGFLSELSSEELYEKLDRPLTVFCGFDPTSDCLHLGNLVPILGLAWFGRMGHRIVALAGGATGMIGDPSGKSSERNLLDEKTLFHNVSEIEKLLGRILKAAGCAEVTVVNNYSWFKEMGLLEFLREIGKQFRLGPMLAKESVSSRLRSSEGMSFTEFSYQLLQGYDFLYLFDHEKTTLQVGGSDQWGNITAGIELIRKMRQEAAFGATFPLLTRSDGKKFGKSEEGAIWLSREKLSVFEFYQYLYRVPDADVIKLLKILTFLDLEEIEQLEQRMVSQPNEAQRRLAEEVTRLIHGDSGLVEARTLTAAAAPGAETTLDPSSLEALFQETMGSELSASTVLECRLVDVLCTTGLLPSRSEAKRLIASSGVAINNEKVSDEQRILKRSDLIQNQYILISLGKKRKVVLKII